MALRGGQSTHSLHLCRASSLHRRLLMAATMAPSGAWPTSLSQSLHPRSAPVNKYYYMRLAYRGLLCRRARSIPRKVSWNASAPMTHNPLSQVAKQEPLELANW